MFSAFQSAILQSNAFQVIVSAITGNDTSALGDVADYHRYRRRLEKLARISEQREKKKFIKEVKKLQEKAEKSPSAVKPDLSEIVTEIRQPEPDYAAISAMLLASLAQLEIAFLEARRKREEEEIIILLLSTP
jgi:hypothetical protein